MVQTRLAAVGNDSLVQTPQSCFEVSERHVQGLAPDGDRNGRVDLLRPRPSRGREIGGDAEGRQELLHVVIGIFP
jgi:hypothetical protein